jgi:hypothetical protein
MTLEIICKAASNKQHHKVTAEPLCRQSDTFVAFWKQPVMHQTSHVRENNQYFFIFD